MPIGEVMFYAEYIGTLEAQERMNSIVDMAAAHGHMSQGASKSHMRELTRAAKGVGRAARRESVVLDPTSTEAKTNFAAFGISVTEVSVSG